ncbi:hypothetical protein EON63_14395 [archaeon]|nr:MAG: hypothetical protein EON63_14395 [archaeon]
MIVVYGVWYWRRMIMCVSIAYTLHVIIIHTHILIHSRFEAEVIRPRSSESTLDASGVHGVGLMLVIQVRVYAYE